MMYTAGSADFEHSCYADHTILPQQITQQITHQNIERGCDKTNAPKNI